MSRIMAGRVHFGSFRADDVILDGFRSRTSEQESTATRLAHPRDLRLFYREREPWGCAGCNVQPAEIAVASVSEPRPSCCPDSVCYNEAMQWIHIRFGRGLVDETVLLDVVG